VLAGALNVNEFLGHSTLPFTQYSIFILALYYRG